MRKGKKPAAGAAEGPPPEAKLFFGFSGFKRHDYTILHVAHDSYDTSRSLEDDTDSRAITQPTRYTVPPSSTGTASRPSDEHTRFTAPVSHLRAASGMRIGSGIRRSLRQRCCSLPKDLTPNRGDGSALPRCAALRLPQSISSNERVHHIHYERSHKQMQACAKRRAALRTWEVHGCVLAVAVR